MQLQPVICKVVSSTTSRDRENHPVSQNFVSQSTDHEFETQKIRLNSKYDEQRGVSLDGQKYDSIWLALSKTHGVVRWLVTVGHMPPPYLECKAFVRPERGSRVRRTLPPKPQARPFPTPCFLPLGLQVPVPICPLLTPLSTSEIPLSLSLSLIQIFSRV